jgi:hypothetical protein
VGNGIPAPQAPSKTPLIISVDDCKSREFWIFGLGQKLPCESLIKFHKNNDVLNSYRLFLKQLSEVYSRNKGQCEWRKKGAKSGPSIDTQWPQHYIGNIPYAKE